MLMRLQHFRTADFKVCWRAAPKLGASLVTYRFPKTQEAVGVESADSDFLTSNSCSESQAGFHLSFALSQPGAGAGSTQRQRSSDFPFFPARRLTLRRRSPSALATTTSRA